MTKIKKVNMQGPSNLEIFKFQKQIKEYLKVIGFCVNMSLK